MYGADSLQVLALESLFWEQVLDACPLLPALLSTDGMLQLPAGPRYMESGGIPLLDVAFWAVDLSFQEAPFILDYL